MKEIYIQDVNGDWYNEADPHNTLTDDEVNHIKKVGERGQYLYDGTFEPRGDTITVDVSKH